VFTFILDKIGQIRSFQLSFHLKQQRNAHRHWWCPDCSSEVWRVHRRNSYAR